MRNVLLNTMIVLLWLMPVGSMAMIIVPIAYSIRPHTYYSNEGYIDDGHGKPGHFLTMKAETCVNLDLGFGYMWEWAPGKNGKCSFKGIMSGHRYMSPTDIADSPMPPADLAQARQGCVNALERAIHLLPNK